MATRTLKAQAPLLDDRIDILKRDAAKYPQAKQIFETAGAILALVQERIVVREESVLLSDYCFDVCEALKVTIQGEKMGHLDEFARSALQDVERIMREVERALRTEASSPGIENGKDGIRFEGKKLEIQQILDALNRRGSSVNGDDDVDEYVPRSLSLDSRGAATISAPGNAFERLLRREFVSDELPSLIEGILTSEGVDDKIRNLHGDDAQTFVDVMYEVLNMPRLSLWARVKCLRRLYRTCGSHGLLPKALKVPICFDRTETPLCSGGNADVWKGEYLGRDVAVKVIRTYKRGILQKTIGRFCKEVVTWKSLEHPNILSLIGATISKTQFAMVSEWMENGSINEFVRENPDVNRLELLRDAARGLTYIHRQGMIHGDLKGDNILVDQTGHSRLADFGFLTIISDVATHLPSTSHSIGGTLRWMGPELLAPEKFGFKESRLTKPSDCYSFGMVVYETISGKKPYHETPDLAVMFKIVDGQRPRRCEGFVDGLWGMVEECWTPQPNGRPSVESILLRLEKLSKLSLSLPTQHPAGGGPEEEILPAGGTGDKAKDTNIMPPIQSVPCQYRTGKTLGSGTYAIIKEAVHIKTGTYYACKVFNKKLMQGREHMIRNEISVLKKVSKSHPNIVTLHDYFETAYNLYFCLDLCTGGELLDRICAKGNYYEKDAVDLVRTIFGAVAHLHKCGIVHRNLKPEKLLFRDPSEDADIMICDFALSRIIESDKIALLTDICGTPGYMAPEIFLKCGHHKPVDIWAMGVITYFLLCGYTPFDRDSQAKETEAIIAGDYKFEPVEYWENVSETAKDFITCCLTLNPAKRPTAQEMLEHEWLSSGHYVVDDTGAVTDLLPQVNSVDARKTFRKAVFTMTEMKRMSTLASLSPGAKDYSRNLQNGKGSGD